MSTLSVLTPLEPGSLSNFQSSEIPPILFHIKETTSQKLIPGNKIMNFYKEAWLSDIIYDLLFFV